MLTTSGRSGQTEGAVEDLAKTQLAKHQLKPTIKWVVNHELNGWLTYINKIKRNKRRVGSTYFLLPTLLYVNLTSSSFSGSLFVENSANVENSTQADVMAHA
jgi:hypothetical protein